MRLALLESNLTLVSIFGLDDPVNKDIAQSV